MRTLTHFRETRRQAFTMLELTIVMTIIALALAIVAPQFNRARDANSVRSAVGDLTGAFSLARQTAVNRRSLTSVVFDTRSATVIVRSGDDPVIVRQLGTAYGILLGANRDSAVYDAKGLGYGVTNLTVTVTRGASADTLTLSRLGRVR